MLHDPTINDPTGETVVSEGSARASAGQRSVKLVCEGVWKVFGPDAESFLAKHAHDVTHERLAEAGLIGAVRDANLEVYEGEIFVIMGLSGSGKSTLVRCMSRLIESTCPSATAIPSGA